MPQSGDPVRALDITQFEQQTTDRPIVRLLQGAAQSVATATNTALTFGSGSEDIDTHGFHDTTTNNSRVTPTSSFPGYYQITATVWWSSATFNDQTYQIFIAKNGTTVPPGQRTRSQSGSATQHSIMTTSIQTANGTGDYFEAIVQQQTGGNLNTQVGGGVNSVLEVVYLRPL